MDNKLIITEAWQTIVVTLKSMRIDDELAALYTKLLKRLPETTLVESGFLTKDSYIKGITSLYTAKEFHIFSEKRKRSRELAFSFGVDGRAMISRGYYDGPQLFFGDWIDALEFIVKKIYKSSLRRNLSVSQRQAVKELIKQLAKD